MGHPSEHVPLLKPQATLFHTLELHPKYLGKGIIQTVTQQLKSEVEGTTAEGVGCIICVIQVDVSPPGFRRMASRSLAPRHAPSPAACPRRSRT